MTFAQSQHRKRPTRLAQSRISDHDDYAMWLAHESKWSVIRLIVVVLILVAGFLLGFWGADLLFAQTASPVGDQLRDTLASILSTLKEGAEQVGKVAHRELPLLVQEVIWKGIATHTINALIALIPCGVLLYVTRRLSRYWFTVDDLSEIDQKGASATTWIVGGILLMLLFLTCVLQEARDAFLIYVAPRVYLLEQVKEMIK